MKILSIIITALIISLNTAVFAFSPSAQPNNLDSLVAMSDVIIIGQIHEIKHSGSFYGYDNDRPMRMRSSDGNTDFGLPVTDYLVKVKRIIKDSAESPVGEFLIYRKLFDYVPDITKANAYLHSKQKREQLLFFKHNPDDTYGISVTMGIMDSKHPQNQAIPLDNREWVYRLKGVEQSPFEKSEAGVRAKITLPAIEERLNPSNRR